MKKLFTLACVAAVVGSAYASTAAPTNLLGCSMELKPETQLMLRQEMVNFDKGLPMSSEVMGTGAWEENGIVWTASVTNLGGVWNHIDPLTNHEHDEALTAESLPYYLVTVLVKGHGIDEETEKEMGVTFQWNLWWPSVYLHSQLVDNWAETGGDNVVSKDYSIASFDSMCNFHRNAEHPEFEYCSMFRETDRNNLPVGDFDYELIDDDEYHLTNPTPKYWGMEYGGCILNDVYYDASGMSNGLYSEINWESFNPVDNRTSFTGKMFVNSSTRFSLNCDSVLRVQGWEKQYLAYPTIREVHIFNRGIGSSSISGDSNPFGVSWGPLQVYEIWGVGEYMDLMINESLANGPYDCNAISIKLSEKAEDGIDFFGAQNYFYGALFCEEGDGLSNGGKWKMLKPELSGDGYTYTVTPVANTLVPKSIFTEANEDYLSVVYKSFQENPVAENTFINFGTTDGFILNYNNGSNEYTGYFKGNVIFHYDANDMSKTRTISAVGDLTPDETLVNEIETANEAPVYYNLQGVRVANPEKGLFIKVAGNKTSKVIL